MDISTLPVQGQQLDTAMHPLPAHNRRVPNEFAPCESCPEPNGYATLSQALRATKDQRNGRRSNMSARSNATSMTSSYPATEIPACCGFVQHDNRHHRPSRGSTYRAPSERLERMSEPPGISKILSIHRTTSARFEDRVHLAESGRPLNVRTLNLNDAQDQTRKKMNPADEPCQACVIA